MGNTTASKAQQLQFLELWKNIKFLGKVKDEDVEQDSTIKTLQDTSAVIESLLKPLGLGNVFQYRCSESLCVPGITLSLRGNDHKSPVPDLFGWCIEIAAEKSFIKNTMRDTLTVWTWKPSYRDDYLADLKQEPTHTRDIITLAALTKAITKSLSQNLPALVAQAQYLKEVAEAYLVDATLLVNNVLHLNSLLVQPMLNTNKKTK